MIESSGRNDRLLSLLPELFGRQMPCFYKQAAPIGASWQWFFDTYFKDASSTLNVVVNELSVVARNCTLTVCPL